MELQLNLIYLVLLFAVITMCCHLKVAMTAIQSMEMVVVMFVWFRRIGVVKVHMLRDLLAK